VNKSIFKPGPMGLSDIRQEISFVLHVFRTWYMGEPIKWNTPVRRFKRDETQPAECQSPPTGKQVVSGCVEDISIFTVVPVIWRGTDLVQAVMRIIDIAIEYCNPAFGMINISTEIVSWMPHQVKDVTHMKLLPITEMKCHIG
jgi:hypothetical protein